MRTKPVISENDNNSRACADITSAQVFAHILRFIGASDHILQRLSFSEGSDTPFPFMENLIKIPQTL